MYSLLVCTECSDLLLAVKDLSEGLGWRCEEARLDVQTGERIAKRECDAALLDVRGGREDAHALIEVFAKSAPFFPLVFVLDELPADGANKGFRYYIEGENICDLEHILISLSCSGMSAEDQLAIPVSEGESGVPRVLIIDDDAHLTSMVGHSLRSMERFDVQVANSGFQAGAILPVFQPDVAIVDISLRDVDGRDVCAFIRHHDRLKKTKVIGMSGYVPPSRLDDQDHQFDAFIEKPFRMQEILDTVEMFLPSSFVK